MFFTTIEFKCNQYLFLISTNIKLRFGQILFFFLNSVKTIKNNKKQINLKKIFINAILRINKESKIV